MVRGQSARLERRSVEPHCSACNEARQERASYGGGLNRKNARRRFSIALSLGRFVHLQFSVHFPFAFSTVIARKERSMANNGNPKQRQPGESFGDFRDGRFRLGHRI
jgi:hypothetical protein